MNKLLSAFALVALLICGAALWLLAPDAFNDYVKTQIETLGSEVTEQKVTVNNVDFKLTKGIAAINGLTLANPNTYQQKNAFTLGTIALDIDIASLTKEPIIIESFTIKDAKAFVEFTKSGGANFKDIIDAINKKLPKTSSSQEGKQKDEPKVSVTKLVLSGIGLSLDLRQLGFKEYQENLPEINLGAIGGKTGLPVSQLGVEISKKIMDSIWQQAKNVQGKKLKDKAKQKLKEETKKIEDKYKEKAKKKLGSLLDKFKG